MAVSSLSSVQAVVMTVMPFPIPYPPNTADRVPSSPVGYSIPAHSAPFFASFASFSQLETWPMEV